MTLHPVKIRKSKFIADWILQNPDGTLTAFSDKELVELYLELWELINTNSKLKQLVPIQ